MNPNSNNYNLISIEDATELSKNKIRYLHKQYGNSGLAFLMGLLDFDKHFVKASGTTLWDESGGEYIDFLGGYGSLNTGHNHPRVIEAIEKVKDLPGILQVTLPPIAGALAYNLSAITPGKLQRSFFCNSGAEAVEGALKLARAASGRTGFVYCENSFHGKTFGALSVTGREKYQKPFEPLLQECYSVPYGNSNALEEMVKTVKPAAFIVEPIQGEGGIITPPEGYLKKVRDICTRYGVILIIDEIQTGLGRTGKMFACEHDNIEPDVICLAKSIGGGVIPSGAFITTDEIWKKAFGSPEKSTLHTSTFSGNSRAAAAGIATLEILQKEDLVARTKENGEYFIARLQELKSRYPLIKEVRGRGLMIGLEFEESSGFADKASLGFAKRLSREYLATLIAAELLNNYGIITAYTLNNPNVIRLEPPLTVTVEQLDYVISSLEQVLARHRGFFSAATSGAKNFIRSLTSKE